MLAQGGNAVDAALAVSLGLGAVCPYYTGLGGGGFALLWMPGWDAPRCLDFREVAPASATPSMFLEGASSTAGGPAIGVPGCIAGWSLLHREFGRLPWEMILSACADICEQGFSIDSNYLRITTAKLEALQPFPELLRVFLGGQAALAPNDWLRNPDLARTYRLLAREGPSAFYEGPLAQRMVKSVQAQGGGLTLEDLAAYRPCWRPTISFPYRGKNVFSVGPPSAGGIQLGEMCALLDTLRLQAPGSAGDLHLLAEAMKISFYERANWIADPSFCHVPVEWLLDRERLGYWADKVCPGATLRLPDEMSTHIPVGRGGTASYLAATLDSGVVMATESLNLWWGSLVVPEGCGFPLNNVMDDFCCRPGQPDAFGLFSSEVNQVEPGKRPASSCTPILVFDQGRPVFAAGSAGGPRIATAVAQMLVNHFDYDLNAQQAVSAGRVHHQWKPDVLWVEPQLSGSVSAELEKFGHLVQTEECRSHGCAATLDWEASLLTAGADFRSGGAAHGV